MSGWTIADPRAAATRDCKVVKINVPYFQDETDYEGILGRAFSSPSDRDWLASGAVIVLCTAEGQVILRTLAENSYMATEEGVRSALEKAAIERQIVVLRWVP